MIEEKLSKKVTVLFSKTTNLKLNDICQKTDRAKSNLVRFIVERYIETVNKSL